MNPEPLLSICIPTWNRSQYLRQSLACLMEQMRDIDRGELELFVSDNGSTDDTRKVVEEFVEKGLNVTYNRNDSNIGPDRNFLKCLCSASGRYVFLLGDDDILTEGAVKFLLDSLRGHDYGLVHIKEYKGQSPRSEVFSNREEFLGKVSYWITFMSGNIIRREAVAMLQDQEKYIGSYLLQMPFYLLSSTLAEENLIINRKIIDMGLAAGSNGGFNFYEVFVENYLSIWEEFVEKGHFSRRCYDAIRRDIFMDFIMRYNVSLLCFRQNVAREERGRRGYRVDGALRIMNRRYGDCPYYWLNMALLPCHAGISACKGIIRRIRRLL